MKTLALLIPLGLAAALILATLLWTSPEPRAAREEISLLAPSDAIPNLPMPVAATAETARESATLPPPPPRVLASLPTRAPTSAPSRLSTPPRQTPAPAPRGGCDPSYPELRTCIPPGPPFDQGCAITDQRLFTVLPPDPQHLDADRDGIGCEPIKASP